MWGDIGQTHFAAWFDFRRPSAAEYTGPNGGPAMAGADVPRFDHNAEGTPIGLLIEPGAELGQADRARLQLDAVGAMMATVFHIRREDDGTIVRRAWYSRNPQATIDYCLAQAGRHLGAGAIPGFRPNLGGFVRYRGVNWTLTGLLGTGQEGEALGDDDGRPLIGS